MNNFLRGFGNFRKNENGVNEYVDYLGTKYTYDPTTKKWKSNGRILSEANLQDMMLSEEEGVGDAGADESGGGRRASVAVEYTVTTNLPEKTRLISELDLIVPDLIQNNIKYGHIVYTSSTNYNEWLGTGLPCCDIDLPQYEINLQEHIDEWTAIYTPYNSYYGNLPEYMVLNFFHSPNVLVELHELLKLIELQGNTYVDVDITSGIGLSAANMLYSTLDSTRTIYPQSDCSHFSYPYLPYFFMQRPSGGDSCTWSYQYTPITADDTALLATYASEKTRLINLLKDRVAQLLTHTDETDSISTAHYITYSEYYATYTYDHLRNSTTQWVLNNCTAIKEASGNRKVAAYVSSVVYEGSEYRFSILRENNYSLPLNELKDNVSALPSLVASSSYMKEVLLEPYQNFWSYYNSYLASVVELA